MTQTVGKTDRLYLAVHLCFIVSGTASFDMGSLTTPTDVCRACGTPRQSGVEVCPWCGAPREHIPEGSGLELDARALAHARHQRELRAREREREAAAAALADVESESPTRELVPEEPLPRVQPATLVGLSQVMAGLAGVLVLAQALWTTDLPTLTRLFLELVAGRSVSASQWLVAGLPWAATAVALGLGLSAAERGLDRPLVRSVPWAAVMATFPVVLLKGWPALHGDFASVLIRRGGRRRATLLLGWSRAALVLMGLAVAMLLLTGLGLVPIPPGLLALAAALAVSARLGHLAAFSLAIPAVLHRPALTGTPLPSRLVCPDCGVDGPTLLRFRDGLAGSACPQCAGALLGPGQVTTLLALAHVEDAAYKREVRLGSVGGRLVSCPQCGTGMRSIRLRTVLGHGCPACGSMWLDKVGLARLSGGRSFAGPAPQRPEPALGTQWPALTALLALIVLTLPWVGVRTGLCPPGAGVCSSVPAAPWGHDTPP